MAEWAAQALAEIRGQKQQPAAPVIPPNLLPPKPINRGSREPSDPSEPTDPSSDAPTDN